MIRKYTLKELQMFEENADYPWWDRPILDHKERMFYTAVYHQMMSNMCLNDEYHPDYAGGFFDETAYKYYENAQDLIFWKTYGTGEKIESYLSTYRSGPKNEE